MAAFVFFTWLLVVVSWIMRKEFVLSFLFIAIGATITFLMYLLLGMGF
jgi:hypothetical protein